MWRTEEGLLCYLGSEIPKERELEKKRKIVPVDGMNEKEIGGVFWGRGAATSRE